MQGIPTLIIDRHCEYAAEDALTALRARPAAANVVSPEPPGALITHAKAALVSKFAN
jgi:hypothetical protein